MELLQGVWDILRAVPIDSYSTVLMMRTSIFIWRFQSGQGSPAVFWNMDGGFGSDSWPWWVFPSAAALGENLWEKRAGSMVEFEYCDDFSFGQ